MTVYIKISKNDVTQAQQDELFKLLDELGIKYYVTREIEK